MAKDKDYIKLIHTQRWLRLRRAVLTAHPCCQMCQAAGRIEPATEVHHHTPVEYGTNYAEKLRLMYDSDNLRALCHSCHVKVHTELGRSGKEATKRRTKEQVEAIAQRFYGEDTPPVF
jgi:5-methylcytosine-specific restriction protein A